MPNVLTTDSQNNGTNVPLLGISASPDLHVQQIPQQNLVIIGDCFPIAEERSFHGLDLTNIMDKLARDHWGRFVAIGHDPRIQSTAIYRDTSGMIPCYYGHSGGNVAIGTEASAILASLNLKPDINWSVIANFLMSPDLRVHETALHGITEVVPGEMVIIHRDETRHQLLWHPNDFIACNQSYDFDASRKLLELTLAQTMATWCRQYRNPMIAASGGLDSSIIAALAAQEGPASLIHFYTSVRHGDERRYVHSLANHIDLPVQTVPAQLDMIAPKTNRSSFRPRPSARLQAAITAARTGLGKDPAELFVQNVIGQLGDPALALDPSFRRWCDAHHGLLSARQAAERWCCWHVA